MNEAKAIIRQLPGKAQRFVNEALATGDSEGGQAFLEVAMVVGFVAILAMSLVTALGDVTGGALAEVSQAFNGPSESQAALPSDAYLGPRIAD